MNERYPPQFDPGFETVRELTQRCQLILSEQAESPEVAGATIANVVAIFVASHHPELRDKALALIIKSAKEVMPVVIEEMIAAGAVPEEWRE